MSRCLVFATTTDLGKSVLSAGLLQSARRAGYKNLQYIKPVQTGGGNIDQSFVHKAVKVDHAATLFSYKDPLSPHVAAARDGQRPPTGREIRSAISACLSSIPNGDINHSLSIIETAGGPLSPGPDGTLQADLLRMCNIQAVLVGDGRLGGISTTLASLEALLNRQYTVASIVVFSSSEDEQETGNCAFLTKLLAIPVRRCSGIPRDPKTPLDAFFLSNQAMFDRVLKDVVEGTPERGEIEN